MHPGNLAVEEPADTVELRMLERRGLGKDLGELGKDLGVSIVKSVKKGAEKVSEWADNEDQKDAPEADVTIEPEEKNE